MWYRDRKNSAWCDGQIWMKSKFNLKGMNYSSIIVDLDTIMVGIFFQIQYLIRSFFQKLFILSAVVWEGGYHGIANRFCCRCYRCCVRLGCCSYGIEFLHSRRMYHIPISNFSIESRSSKLPRERSVFPGWSGRFSYRRSKWQLQTWDLSSSHCPPN